MYFDVNFVYAAEGQSGTYRLRFSILYVLPFTFTGNLCGSMLLLARVLCDVNIVCAECHSSLEWFT